MNPRLRTILAQCRARMEEIYGTRLAGLVLFGSQARGDGEPDSDIDVLVVLDGPLDRRSERERTIQLVADLSLEYDTVIMPVFTDAETYRDNEFSLYRNIRHEGIGF